MAQHKWHKIVLSFPFLLFGVKTGSWLLSTAVVSQNEGTASVCFLPPGLSASVYTSIYVGFEEPDAITYVSEPTQLHSLSAMSA